VQPTVLRTTESQATSQSSSPFAFSISFSTVEWNASGLWALESLISGEERLYGKPRRIMDRLGNPYQKL
jgi:hypothetical protein